MKIKDALHNLLIDGSIFNYLPVLEDLGIETAPTMLGALYFKHSGNKSINTLTQYVLNTAHNEMQKDLALGQYINEYFKDSWTRVYTALTAEYNPLENYDRTELSTVGHTGADTDTFGAQQNEEQPYYYEDVESVTAYDSNTYQNRSKVKHDVTNRINNIGQRIDTKQKNTTDTTNSRVHGNIGVTTSQQMITAELELRRKNFFDIMFKDIDSLLCLKIYE